LAAIIGSASALRSQGEALGAVRRERLLANLENEARDMSLMADNILQMARLSQPQSQLAMQWEGVEELLGSAVQRMRRRWPGARIQWRLPGGLPPVQAEAGLIAQVIANLVDNALRHAGAESEVVIQAGRSREGIFIAVRDHGPGLPQADVQRLFERFQRGVARGVAPGSAGLGLAICKTIVEAHGGQIQARRCEPGSEFRIDLPAALPSDANG
jgi:two-component system, OmpR family, sensor histidine kinase KdpD